MREYIVKTTKVGDCIVIALPKQLVSAEQIREGMDVKITVQKCPKTSSPACDDDPWRQLE
jgi:antitoxin component of MazEF toxin-antitoxin module